MPGNLLISVFQASVTLYYIVLLQAVLFFRMYLSHIFISVCRLKFQFHISCFNPVFSSHKL